MERKGFSRIILTLLLFLLLLPLSCLWFDRNTPTEPPPGTHREQLIWLDQDITIGSWSNKAYFHEVLYQDTVFGEITLIEGNFINFFFVSDDYNYREWKHGGGVINFIYSSYHSHGGTFHFWMPKTDTCVFCVQNAELDDHITIHAYITITRWIK